MFTSRKMQINNEWPFNDESADKLNGIFFRIKVEDKTGRFETADLKEQATA